MAKRGKYRQYNNLMNKRKDKREKWVEKPQQTFQNTDYRKKVVGRDMYSRVAAEHSKHYIGERVILNRFIEKNEKERTVGGVVVGLYPHFLLIDCGNYKTSVTYKDLVLGGRA